MVIGTPSLRPQRRDQGHPPGVRLLASINAITPIFLIIAIGYLLHRAAVESRYRDWMRD